MLENAILLIGLCTNDYEQGRIILNMYKSIPQIEIKSHNNIEELRKYENKDLPEFLFALGVGLPKTSGSTETANYKVNLIELRNWVDVYDNYDDDEDL